MVPQSLIAFDTDHIKGYVFGTNKLKEIRGASSILDYLNRTVTVKEAEKLDAKKIYANGGSALFIIDSNKAEALGREVQRLYHEQTGGGASITYAIQPMPENNDSELLKEDVTMEDVLKLLRLHLRLAKDSLQMSDLFAHPREMYVAFPSHAFLCTCDSCGIAYAEEIRQDGDQEGRFCRVCLGKRHEDIVIRDTLRKANSSLLLEDTLWGRILKSLGEYRYYTPSSIPERPNDFNEFRRFTSGKEYLGLIYADANSMGKAIEQQKTLQQVEDFATLVDEAVFKAMAYAINQHLPVYDGMFPFDILMVGGDDIVMVTPADKAMQVAYTLAEQFHKATNYEYTLSIGVVLAPVKYPFNLQRLLAEDVLKAAKKKGAEVRTNTNSVNTSENNKAHEQTGDKKKKDKSKQEQSRINFVVVMGNTSLEYGKIYEGLYRKLFKDEFYATMRPYSLNDLGLLLGELKDNRARRLGRTKLHQLHEAILKRNRTNTIFESLALLRNWKAVERDFVKDIVKHFDRGETERRKRMGTLFPWLLDDERSSIEKHIYYTPLLDFIELYDFVSLEKKV